MFSLPLETIGRALLDACTPLGMCLHRIIDWLSLEGTSGGHLVHPTLIK